MKRMMMALSSAAAMIVMVCSSAHAGAQPPVSVPEPSTMLLLGAGVAGLAAVRLFRNRRK